jgi:hypothetical protein
MLKALIIQSQIKIFLLLLTAFIQNPSLEASMITSARCSLSVPFMRMNIYDSQESKTIGEFEFRIVEVAFDETAMGFATTDMGKNDKVMFVEFELLSGNKENFKNLEITVTYNQGQESKAVILTSGGLIKMLATVTIKSTPSEFRPKAQNIAWAYVVPKDATGFYLNFPNGDVIDLTPFIE